ncbi:hypothetical protein SDC9_09359 [bioreactor metagenome]|uniref:BREX-4 system phosphatase PglZ n=1 Tax=bioreactor metagenome TaxID=1076179 RepID=A0A644T9V3_9ZZZZ|nr:BREX-4 system phosphatase PglZ [Desulfitobacterium hafniense]MEA5024249.1 BREX-4 system phosphatase PglZ [Desulfitobacterium hafniense]
MSDWVTKIEKYFSGTLQYPLLVVLSSDEYKEVLVAFSNTPKIKVSDYCVGADKEPDTLQLEYDVRCKTGRHLLIGLGDYLASKSNIAKKTLLPYKDLVLQSDGRVAILLSPHMYPVAKEIVDGDPRVRTRILLPKAAPAVDMVNSSTLVYGIKAYLEACEKCESVGSVKTARNIQNANVINPENAFDELKHKFPNEFNRLSQNAGTPENWGELLMNLNKSKKSMVQYLAAQGFASFEYIFLDYAKRNNYKAWLYFINLKLNTSSQSYLGFVAAKSDNLNSLFQSAKTAILDVDINDKLFKPFYEQRKTMLKGCADVDMADFVPKIHVRGADRISYLTDNTKVERQAVVVSLCEGANGDSLEVSYPDLYLYLQDYQFENDKFTKYFAAYKKCKLENRVSHDFVRIVADYAATRPYNSLPARSSLISSLDDGSTVLIFLDAFGVEYLGYVKEKCAELKLRFASKIARADLPTITSLNRGFYDEWHGKKETPIKDLDELKHHPERGYDYNNSPYPIHLVEELDVIKTALERAKIKLLTGECRKVLIVSDHGASRLAVISPDVQVPKNNCEAKSSGRYCMGDELPFANNIVAEVEGEYAVIADYSRFEGSRAASVETHGGATLEEVLVPIIEITLVDNNIQVTLEKNVVEISYKTVPTLVLIITPDCDNVTASVNQTTYKAEKLEKSKYKVVMPELKKGKYTIDIFENQNKIDSKEFTVKSKGFAERDIF